MAHLGIDIGGTKVLLRAESGGLPAHESSFRWSSTDDPAADLDLLARHVAAVRDQTTISAVGVAVPATLDTAGNVVTWPNRAHWAGVAFESFLHELFPGVRVGCADDGDLAALAEAEDAGSDSLLYLGVGSGIGGGLVLGRQPCPGLGRGSCEIGHVLVDPAGPRCTCGRHGCLQAIASGPATLGRAAERNPDGAEHLPEAWSRGRPWATTVVEESCAALAVAISGVTELVRPDLARIGGGFATALPGFVDRVAERVRDLARPGHPAIPVQPAALGAGSSLRGGILLAATLADRAPTT